MQIQTPPCTIFDILIIGAGLSGLVTAYRLKEEKPHLKLKVTEARDRVGGRLYSLNGHDLGATWRWRPKETLVQDVSDDLGVSLFPTNVHEGEMRFIGGAQTLALRLYEKLSPDTVLFRHSVEKIDYGSDPVKITVKNLESDDVLEWSCRKVIVAVPPLVILRHISFSPELSERRKDTMQATPTWMSDSLKVVLLFSKKFWNNVQLRHPFYDLSSADSPAIKLFIVGSQAQKIASTPVESLERQLLESLSHSLGDTVREMYISMMVHNWGDDI